MQNLVSETSAVTPDGAGKVVGPGSFLTLYYHIMLENDTDIVTTFDNKPATLLFGQEWMAFTLEQTLLGIREGGRTTLRLAPKYAFGPRNPGLLQRVSLAAPRENSSFEKDYQPDDLVGFNAPSGGKYVDMFREVGETSALFSPNHPLAGQTIVFEIQLIGIL